MAAVGGSSQLRQWLNLANVGQFGLKWVGLLDWACWVEFVCPYKNPTVQLMNG
jgi:hypothetical protein